MTTERKAAIGRTLPVGRTGTVEELASMAIYVADGESDFITGQVWRAD